MSNSKPIKIKLGKTTVKATYKRLDAVAKPGATVGHHDFVEHAASEQALDELRTKLKNLRGK